MLLSENRNSALSTWNCSLQRSCLKLSLYWSLTLNKKQTTNHPLPTQVFPNGLSDLGPPRGCSSGEPGRQEGSSQAAPTFLLLQEKKQVLNSKAVLLSCCPLVYSWTRKCRKSLALSLYRPSPLKIWREVWSEEVSICIFKAENVL